MDDAVNARGMPLRKVAMLVAGIWSVTDPATMRPSGAGWVAEAATYPPSATARAMTPSNEVRKVPDGTVYAARTERCTSADGGTPTMIPLDTGPALPAVV